MTAANGEVSNRPFSNGGSAEAPIASVEDGSGASDRLFTVWVETHTGTRHVVVRAVPEDSREETVQRLLREVADDPSGFMPAGAGVYLRRAHVVAVRWEEDPPDPQAASDEYNASQEVSFAVD